MSKAKTKRIFSDLFNTDYSILKVKYNVRADEAPADVQIKNTLGKKAGTNSITELARICTSPKLKDFVDFYSKHDGFDLATPKSPRNVVKKTLLRQIPASDLEKFTSHYLPGGRWAWTIDLNKTKALYRNENKWLAFAEVNGGPACLTIFLDGENAGNVFLLNAQPHFNILKPIARTYAGLLDRIAKDPAAFFKLIKAYVVLPGENGQNYGHVPLEYVDKN
ncbi:MAG TPA: hypothetical protein VFU15_15520 [Bacteroidia bacterium]|nr:hypothetical protein [Bacteroidia bacterium]